MGDTKNAFYNVIDAVFGGKQALPTKSDKTVDMIPLTPSKPSSAPETQPKPDKDKPTQPAVKWDQGIVLCRKKPDTV